MYFPLKNPNLPENRVTVVAVSTKASEKLLNKLDEHEITAIKTITNNLVTDVGYHTDLNLLNYSEGNILIDKSQKEIFVNFLTKGYSLKTISEVKSPYPYDCRLNCVIMGDKLICNPKTASDEVLLIANELDIKIIPVNQGYTKCSICLLNDNALITDDESIYNACKTNQIASLLISKGSVKLNGFDYGFIGGCTGLIDKNKLLFNGDINYHNDCNMIIDFLNSYNIEAVIIDNEPLTDIGSIIPLCEKPNK
ncbi:MAG: hypothetical protein IJZ57_03885 [Clostridia bacterium]|nr:hypothetical protein [Clostridia bacterium]